MKTRTKDHTELPEIQIAKKIGKFCTVELKRSNNGKAFKSAIPEFENRAQVLHGMAIGNLEHAFYVVASQQHKMWSKLQ
jgi:hypothetical protein